MFACLLFSLNILSAQYLTPEWTKFQLTRGNGGGPGNLPIILVDSLQNVVVCGDTYHPGPILGFITTKYDSNGVFLWEQRYDQWNIDQISSAAIDHRGDIYVGGKSSSPTTYLLEGILFKYSSNGGLLWSFTYKPNIVGQQSNIVKILVLPNEKILVSGTFVRNSSQESGSFLSCLNVDGSIAWETELSDGSAFTMGETVSGFALWGIKSISNNDFFVCWIIDYDGNLISTANTEIYNDNFENYYHIDNQGNMYIGDFLGEYKISKYNTNGNLDWFYSKPYIAHPNPWYVTARSGSIATDNDGNVFFCGLYYADSIIGRNTIITCLDVFGEKKWEHLLYFNGDNNVSGSNVGKFADGNYNVTGGYSTNLLANKYTCYIAYFDVNGYILGGVSEMPGATNYVHNISIDKKNTYISGVNSDSLFYEKQFVSKHKKPIVSTTTQPATAIQPLSIYPNPATQMAWINCNYEGKAATGQIEIIDHNGRVVMTQWIEIEQSNTQHLAIKGVTRLPAGTYGIVLRVGNMVYSGQFIKA